MTDREIIDRIKKDLIAGDTADFLTLAVVDRDTMERHCFSEVYLDEMFKTLFDFSLTKTVVAMSHFRIEPERFLSSNPLLSYNGSPLPIIGYTFAVQESNDHQTNITPRLMKFLEVVMTRSGVDRLAYPMYRNRIEYEFKGYSDGIPILCAPPPDPWEILESYMEE